MLFLWKQQRGFHLKVWVNFKTHFSAIPFWGLKKVLSRFVCIVALIFFFFNSCKWCNDGGRRGKWCSEGTFKGTFQGTLRSVAKMEIVFKKWFPVEARVPFLQLSPKKVVFQKWKGFYFKFNCDSRVFPKKVFIFKFNCDSHIFSPEGLYMHLQSFCIHFEFSLSSDVFAFLLVKVGVDRC